MSFDILSYLVEKGLVVRNSRIYPRCVFCGIGFSEQFFVRCPICGRSLRRKPRKRRKLKVNS